jgi:hypothetical protein
MLLIAASHAQDFCCCRVLDTPISAGLHGCLVARNPCQRAIYGVSAL